MADITLSSILGTGTYAPLSGATFTGTVGVGGAVQFGGILSVVRPASTQVSLTINQLGISSAQIGFLAGGTTLRIGNSYADGTLANSVGIDIDTAGFLTGAGISVNAGGNTIVKRHASGYIFANYFNTTADITNTAPSHVAIQNSTDSFIRWQTASQFRINHVGLSGTGSATTLDEGISKFLRWKNYGNGHIIFDASQSTDPNGVACNNANSAQPWSGTYPTLMGYNGSTTYGVRVDTARTADQLAGQAPSTGAGANTVATRDASGNITAAAMYASNWFRSAGNTGWHAESWSVGIYASDATYLRSYQNKVMIAGDFLMSSDSSLKTNVKDYAYKSPLRPVAFDWIDGNKPDVGFIANEVEVDYPELVDYSTDSETGITTRVLSYPKLTVVLSAQINTLQARIDELENTLLTRMAELERKLLK